MKYTPRKKDFKLNHKLISAYGKKIENNQHNSNKIVLPFNTNSYDCVYV